MTPLSGLFTVREEVSLKIKASEGDYDTIVKKFCPAYIVSVGGYEK